MANPNADQIKDLTKNVIEEQIKYMYYIIGIAIAAIAYSVNISLKSEFQYQQIPLALAVINWAISVYNGLKYLENSIVFKKHNVEYLKNLDGFDPNNPTQFDKVEKDLTKAHLDASSNYKWNNRTLYIGLICFIIWWGIRIYYN